MLAAQVTHAAGESSPGNLPDGTFAVVLAARDVAHLEEIAAALAAGGVAHHLVREPDEPHNGAAMAIGVVPTRDRRRVSRILGRLPLLR